MRKLWKSPIIIGAVLLVLAIIAAHNASDASDGNGNDDSVSQDDKQAVLDLLTVHQSDNDCSQLVPADQQDTQSGIVAWNLTYQLPVADGGRRFSDAISTPFMSADKIAELKTEFCQNPLTAGQALNFFANWVVFDQSIGDLNPWLNDWRGDQTVIRPQAESFLVDPTVDFDQAVQRNKDWQAEAELLNTLLDRMAQSGEQSLPSTLNYHLAGAGMQVATVPDVALNPEQENLPALVFTVTAKTDDCVTSMGFNLADKRVEEFSCETPSAAPTTSEAPPTDTVQIPGTPATSTSPGGGTSSTPSSPPPGTTTTRTTPPPAPTTSSPPPAPPTSSGKHAPDAPVQDAPRGTDERATSTSAAAVTTASDPGRGDSGAGATNTTQAPATSSPAVTVPNNTTANNGQVAP